MAYLDKFSLAGKVALVTGGAYGIGFAIARALAKAGAQIAFNCRRQAHLEQALANYRAEGIEAHGYIADVTDEAQVTELVKTIEKELGVVDILVNNAGIIKRIPMIEMSVADFRQVVDIDLTAPFIVAKAVLPGMIQKGHGKIINICSMMSELGRETVSAYAAAKGGLKMLTRNICSEYGGGEYPVQRHRTGLYCDASDRAFAGKTTGWQPPSFRSVHYCQNAGGPLGHTGRPGRPGCLSGIGRFRLCKRPYPLCGRGHPGLYRQAALRKK